MTVATQKTTDDETVTARKTTTEKETVEVTRGFFTKAGNFIVKNKGKIAIGLAVTAAGVYAYRRFRPTVTISTVGVAADNVVSMFGGEHVARMVV